MNIIYTWFKNKYKKWYSEEFEILTLMTSIKKASEYYKNIVLYTNKESLSYLDEYNLPIKIEIVEEDCGKLWVLNKINTYEAQTIPFIHIDADFILLDKLPEKLEKSRIGFQSKEDFSLHYKDKLNTLMSNGIEININTEEVFNFGIYICNDLNINKIYCNKVKKLAKEVENAKPLLAYNAIVEQYSMSSLLKDLNITPSLLADTINDLDERRVMHLMHNKNSKEYFKKIKVLYETI